MTSDTIEYPHQQIRTMYGESISVPGAPFDVNDQTVLLVRRGSESHGLYVEPLDADASDDRDLHGVVIPPLRFYIGLDRWEHADAIIGKWDTVLYEIGKQFRMLMQQNANVLSTIWTQPEDILVTSWPGNQLIEHRRLFQHERFARERFIGYARQQLHRTTAFDAPTMQRIDELETRLREVGIEPRSVLSDDYEHRDGHAIGLLTRQYVKMRQRYRKAYMGAKRWELVRKIGYDSKNASHMIRLLKMGLEYLRTGELRVRRTDDREELLSIKRGEWSLENVKRYGEALFSEIESTPSVLPNAYDDAAIERLLIACVQWQHYDNGNSPSDWSAVRSLVLGS